MGAIGEYIISVTSAAVVCGCVCSFFETKGTISSVLKLLCGICLAMVALQPVVRLQLPDISEFIHAPVEEAERMSVDAETMAAQKQREYISERCQSYIAEKADALGCSLEITVTLGIDPPYAPSAVRLVGKVSPYARSQLSQWIRDSFAIETEDQTWVG